ncbi:hypothetical protein KM043_013719 [Ampulex compressa]|nr:hypothetical protein KM043_013719 [Ampulex compressa]
MAGKIDAGSEISQREWVVNGWRSLSSGSGLGESGIFRRNQSWLRGANLGIEGPKDEGKPEEGRRTWCPGEGRRGRGLV